MNVISNLSSDKDIPFNYDWYCNQPNLTTTSSLDTNASVGYDRLGADGGRQEYSCWNHPDSVLRLEMYRRADKTINCGLIPSLFFIGAPPNIVSMIIFYRQGLRDRMNLCLFCLAFTDLMYVTAQFITVSFCFIDLFAPNQVLFWRWTLLIHGLTFIFGFGYFSGCLTMIIAVERCICVMFPMKAATLISTKTMAAVLTATFLLVQGLCSVYAVKEQVSSVTDPFTGELIFATTTTMLYLRHSVLRIVENIVLSVVCFCCFTIVLITTIMTVVQLQRAMSWRKSTASGSAYPKGQAVLVRMLVAVSCVYILCTAPNVALALARFTVPEFRADGAQCSLFHAGHMMGFFICMFNSSINFFVYSAMSSRFRQELKACLLCSTTVREVKESKSLSRIS